MSTSRHTLCGPPASTGSPDAGTTRKPSFSAASAQWRTMELLPVPGSPSTAIQPPVRPRHSLWTEVMSTFCSRWRPMRRDMENVPFFASSSASAPTSVGSNTGTGSLMFFTLMGCTTLNTKLDRAALCVSSSTSTPLLLLLHMSRAARFIAGPTSANSRRRFDPMAEQKMTPVDRPMVQCTPIAFRSA